MSAEYNMKQEGKKGMKEKGIIAEERKNYGKRKKKGKEDLQKPNNLRICLSN